MKADKVFVDVESLFRIIICSADSAQKKRAVIVLVRAATS